MTPGQLRGGAALLRGLCDGPLARVEARDAPSFFLASPGHGRRRARAKLEASSSVCRLLAPLIFLGRRGGVEGCVVGVRLAGILREFCLLASVLQTASYLVLKLIAVK